MRVTCAVLALSKRNTNAAEVILFLHRIVSVLVEYFKELEEESIRDNFVIIYELMDEMMDFGYPQTTESKILQECVRSPLAASRSAPARVRGCAVCGADARAHGLQVHHAGVVQAGSAGPAADRGHECGIVEVRGHSVPEERGVLGCDRERQPFGESPNCHSFGAGVVSHGGWSSGTGLELVEVVCAPCVSYCPFLHACSPEI